MIIEWSAMTGFTRRSEKVKNRFLKMRFTFSGYLPPIFGIDGGVNRRTISQNHWTASQSDSWLVLQAPGGTCRTNSTLYFGLNSCQMLNVSIADIEETVPKRFCSKHGTQPFCLSFGLSSEVNGWFCKPRRDLPDEQQPVFWTHSCQISMHFYASVRWNRAGAAAQAKRIKSLDSAFPLNLGILLFYSERRVRPVRFSGKLLTVFGGNRTKSGNISLRIQTYLAHWTHAFRNKMGVPKLTGISDSPLSANVKMMDNSIYSIVRSWPHCICSGNSNIPTGSGA